MKKFGFLLLLLCLVFVLLAFTGCEESTRLDMDPEAGVGSGFQYIGRDTIDAQAEGRSAEYAQYYVDLRTEVVYVMLVNPNGQSTFAGLSPLVDYDGTWVTYGEFKDTYNISKGD